ncbi:hypothetical protein JIX56_22415 [Streptomyces sp. CA-210063]|uniref:hypothetical protein n=1 Tax=Streptomyces sp. CA-210063 TaxID=2801029 RepID=UPI00214AB5A1|nr:hypothetical protein [Streptomyces sp. CA-210063]UUU32433.1 hypothetical protein JIX56_22415 [Streptomyces sp. CA-210063]
MADLIGRLIARLSLLLTPPPPGRHHRTTHHHPTHPTAPLAPPTPSLPTHRSPYGLDVDTPLDGAATVAVRPYVTADEQRHRRRELAMATLGLDMPGPYWIHGMEVA